MCADLCAACEESKTRQKLSLRVRLAPDLRGQSFVSLVGFVEMRHSAVQLYSDFLRASRACVDPVCGWYVRWRVRERLEQNRGVLGSRRVKLLAEGRRQLKLLQDANKGETRSATTLVELAYGVTGRMKVFIQTNRLRSRMRPEKLPNMDSMPSLLRIAILTDEDTFRTAVREHILPLLRPQRRLYASVLGSREETEITKDAVQLLRERFKQTGLASVNLAGFGERRHSAVQLYSGFLRASRACVDPVCGWYVRWRVRERLEQNRGVMGSRLVKLLAEGRRQLRQLQDANKGETRSARRLVELAYGVTGRMKHFIRINRLRSRMRPKKLPNMDSMPFLIRIAILTDEATFRAAVREHILPLLRPQRRLYASVLDSWEATKITEDAVQLLVERFKQKQVQEELAKKYNNEAAEKHKKKSKQK